MNKKKIPDYTPVGCVKKLHIKEIPVRRKSLRLWTNFTWLKISQSPAPCVTTHLTRAALIHDFLTTSLTTPFYVTLLFYINNNVIYQLWMRKLSYFYVNKNVIYQLWMCELSRAWSNATSVIYELPMHALVIFKFRMHALSRARSNATVFMLSLVSLCVQGYTPLHLAAINGHEDIIELLVTVYSQYHLFLLSLSLSTL
jgi:hypothetical protein